MNNSKHSCLRDKSCKSTVLKLLYAYIFDKMSHISGDSFQQQPRTINMTKLKLTKSYHSLYHDDVIKWKHFPRYCSFVRGIHRSPVNSPHKGQWRRALMFSLICVWINGSVNNREAGDLRRYLAHYDVIVMYYSLLWPLMVPWWLMIQNSWPYLV